MRLHEVVNNMLNVAKIDNRALDLHFQSVSLAHLLERISQSLASALAERKLTLVVEPLTAVPDIQADLDALHSVFSHLLLNAIKYTPDGGQISVSPRLIGEGTPSHVELIFSDTGIGIASDALELIFTKFYQTGQIGLHSSGRTKFKGGGPGLGLAIVRGIVDAHNGHVWADSLGYSETDLPGSQFYVVLPIRQ
jgi:signal transduction histidine kinase